MKKIIFFLLATVMFTLSVNAQRYAIIDTRYILSKLPDYSDAQKKLMTSRQHWINSIEITKLKK